MLGYFWTNMAMCFASTWTSCMMAAPGAEQE
jgi:hypothetical protein